MLDAYLCNTVRTVPDHEDEPQPHVQIPFQVLNYCQGKKATATNTGEFLAAYALANGLNVDAIDSGDDGTQDSEADFYSFTFKGHNHQDNLVRCMTTRHLGAVDVSHKARWKRFGLTEKVHVVYGTLQSKADMSERRISHKEDQLLIARYFERNRDPKRYVPSQLALGDAADWAEANLSPAQLHVAERFVRGACWTCPRLQPNEKATTARLFDDATWQNMQSELRARLMPDWVELDLQAAYLGIWLRVLETHGMEKHAPLLAEVVGVDGSGAWDRARVALNASDAVTKRAMKDAVYATLFTGSKETVEEGLIEAGVSQADAQQLINSPLAMELRRTVRKMVGWLRSEGHLIDAYDAHRKRAGKDSTALHFICSTWELRLVARAYEAAKMFLGGYIAVHSHDGISVCHTDLAQVDAFVTHLKTAVDGEADQLGVRTRFTVKTVVRPQVALERYERSTVWEAAEASLG